MTPLLRLVGIAVGITIAFILLMLGPAWLSALTPRWLVRGAILGALWCTAAIFSLSVLVAPLTAIVLARAILKKRRRRIAIRPIFPKLLSLCVVAILGAALAEPVAAIVLAKAIEFPELPTAFSKGPERPGDLSIVVIGESSARGEPYHPKLSVGQVLGKELEKRRPDRRVDVDVRATGGICLEQAILTLGTLERKPDALLIYAGHNEFQARYGWSRVVSHYDGEAPPLPIHEALLAAGARYSSLLKVARDSIERNRLDAPPAPNVAREPIDHPVCSKDEYAFLLSEYRRRLEETVKWCERIGALPIVVIPPGNDADFAPVRSVLEPAATPEIRARAARDLAAARSEEKTDPSRAELIYEDLLKRHPNYAEAHFRLGRLLRASGRPDEALPHFERARDLDGMPMRCPKDFLDAIRQVGSRHDVIMVEGQAVIRATSPDGVTDDDQFHDPHHLKLSGYVALAEDLLAQLSRRGLLGLPRSDDRPRLDPAEAARSLGVDRALWIDVCRRSADYFARTATMRYDPDESFKKAHAFKLAADAISAGKAPEEVGIPGLGIRPRPVGSR